MVPWLVCPLVSLIFFDDVVLETIQHFTLCWPLIFCSSLGMANHPSQKKTVQGYKYCSYPAIGLLMTRTWFYIVVPCRKTSGVFWSGFSLICLAWCSLHSAPRKNLWRPGYTGCTLRKTKPHRTNDVDRKERVMRLIRRNRNGGAYWHKYSHCFYHIVVQIIHRFVVSWLHTWEGHFPSVKTKRNGTQTYSKKCML